MQNANYISSPLTPVEVITVTVLQHDRLELNLSDGTCAVLTFQQLSDLRDMAH